MLQTLCRPGDEDGVEEVGEWWFWYDFGLKMGEGGYDGSKGGEECKGGRLVWR